MTKRSTAVSSVVRGWGGTALLVLMLFAFRSAVADHYHVPSGSMQHTLVPGDHVLVDKRAFGWRIPFTDAVMAGERLPQRGEVVIFDSPADGSRLIKRIVALPGDTVSLKQGRLTVNGEPLAIPGISSVERFGDREAPLDLLAGGGPDIPTTVVPEGQLLALGDHRGNSRDSRYFGWVAADSVYGRAIAVFYRGGEGFSWHPL